MSNTQTQTRIRENIQLQSMDGDTEIEPMNRDETRVQVPDTSRESKLILLYCSLLQLPIWGFVMSYGVLQDSYTSSLFLKGNPSLTGLVGTTLNGTLYMSLPIISTLLSYGNTTRYRKPVAIFGILLSSLALVVSSWATEAWQLILTQGVLLGFGSALTYSPTTLCLDSWFVRRKSYAYGVAFAAKNLVGTVTPFLNPALVEHLGIRNTLRVWAAITFGTGMLCLPFLTTRESGNPEQIRRRKTEWGFLKHSTFYIFNFANMVFSSGYGLPQTYLPSYAKQILHVSSTNSALMLSLFNAPGMISCIAFGALGDGVHIFGRYSLTPSTVTFLSAIPSAISVFLIWGLAGQTSVGVLALFSAVYGFFAGAYSSTWGGALKEIQREAAANNEAVDTGVVYGLLNGGRGLGFVVGGLAGVELLKSGAVDAKGLGGYGSDYGSVILYTGISAVIGGWSVLWSLRNLIR